MLNLPRKFINFNVLCREEILIIGEYRRYSLQVSQVTFNRLELNEISIQLLRPLR